MYEDAWVSSGFLKYTSQRWDEFSPLLDHLVRQFQENGYSNEDYMVLDMGSVAYHPHMENYLWSPMLPYNVWVDYLTYVHGIIKPKTFDWETYIEYRCDLPEAQQQPPVFITISPPYEEYRIFQNTSSYPHKHFLFSPIANSFGRLGTQKKKHFRDFSQLPAQPTSVKVYRERKYVSASASSHPITFTFRQVFEAEHVGETQAHSGNPIPASYYCTISSPFRAGGSGGSGGGRGREGSSSKPSSRSQPLPLLFIHMLEQMITLQHKSVEAREAREKQEAEKAQEEQEEQEESPSNPRDPPIPCDLPDLPDPFIVSAEDCTEIDVLGKRVQSWIEKFSVVT